MYATFEMQTAASIFLCAGAREPLMVRLFAITRNFQKS